MLTGPANYRATTDTLMEPEPFDKQESGMQHLRFLAQSGFDSARHLLILYSTDYRRSLRARRYGPFKPAKI